MWMYVKFFTKYQPAKPLRYYGGVQYGERLGRWYAGDVRLAYNLH